MAVSRPTTVTQRDSSDCFQSIPIEVENGIVGTVFDASHSNFTKEQASSEYIKSWAGVTRGLDALEIDRRMNTLTALKFEIVSARICTCEENNRKYVAYTIMATLAGSEEDQYPAVVERRYTEFLHLYLSLRRDYPELMQSVQFPKKAIIGNFSPETISGRRSGFEQFLERIGSTSQLRNSSLVTDFLQRKELIYALKLIKEAQFGEASYLVENAFRLLNKLQTDRSIAVLQSLCLLVCVLAAQDNPRAMEWASLAVRRFQGVSDSDLLRYYVPLLNLSVDVSRRHGKGTALLGLQEHLNDLRQRGVALHDSTPLLNLLLEDLPSFPLCNQVARKESLRYEYDDAWCMVRKVLLYGWNRTLFTRSYCIHIMWFLNVEFEKFR